MMKHLTTFIVGVVAALVVEAIASRIRLPFVHPAAPTAPTVEQPKV